MIFKNYILVSLAFSLIPYINTHAIVVSDSSFRKEKEIMDSWQNASDYGVIMSSDPLSKKLLGWIKNTSGGKKLTEEMRTFLPVNTGKVLKSVMENPLRSHSYQMIPITDMSEFKGERILKLMKSKYTIFSTPDRSSFVYYDKKRKSWYLHQFDPSAMSNVLAQGNRVPVSKCLNAVNGHMGSVSSLVRMTIQSEGQALVETEINFPRTAHVLISLSGHLQVGSSLKISAAVTCVVQNNQYAQPYISPYYIHVPEGRRVKVNFDSSTGLEITDEWEKTEPISSLVNKTPLVECAISDTRDVCGSDPRPGLHIEDLKLPWATENDDEASNKTYV